MDKSGEYKMHSNPLVSIIIPVYNGSNYLAEAIDSALNQSYENCEVIVINDGSCDNGMTEKIALSYGDRIRYFRKENGGVATALNLGIYHMKGEYFSWLSHDDVYYPNKIQAEIEAVMDQDDVTRTVLCDYDYWDMSSDTCKATNYTQYYDIKDLTNSVFSVIQFPIHMCCALIHKSQFERVGCFNEKLRYGQDVEFAFRLLKGQRAVWVPNSLYRVRVHRESDTVKFGNELDKDAAEVYGHMLDSLTNQELKDIFGTAEKGICKLCSHIFASNQIDKLEQEEVRLNKCYENSHNENDIINVKKEINSLCDNKSMKVVIYGAGRYGKRLYYELKNRQIMIESYIDLNAVKIGKAISGVACRAIQYYDKEKDNILIIVSPRQADSIEEHLKKLGFKYVITRQDIESIMIKYSPQL